MTNLSDKEYEDEHGKMVPSEQIDCLGSYKYHCDGFFQWTCGRCGVQHASRWYRVAGLVWYCGRPRTTYFETIGPDRLSIPFTVYDEGCGAKNLLVRTNCAEITESLTKKWEETERWKENEKLRGIQKLNHDKVWEIYREMMRAAEVALTAAANKAEREVSKPDETGKPA